jgi:uncharacterized protein with LGFP repeats
VQSQGQQQRRVKFSNVLGRVYVGDLFHGGSVRVDSRPFDDNHPGCQRHAVHGAGSYSREVSSPSPTRGAPFDNELKTKDGTGSYQQFDGGVLIYKTGGPVYFVWGKIRDAWNANQASQGKLGYPTADEQVQPDGSYKSTFEHGTITWKPAMQTPLSLRASRS